MRAINRWPKSCVFLYKYQFDLGSLQLAGIPPHRALTRAGRLRLSLCQLARRVKEKGHEPPSGSFKSWPEPYQLSPGSGKSLALPSCSSCHQNGNNHCISHVSFPQGINELTPWLETSLPHHKSHITVVISITIMELMCCDVPSRSQDLPSFLKP